MKTREQIDQKYKWDLSSYIKNEKEIEEIFEIMKNLTKILPKYQGKLNNKDVFYERMTKYKDDFIKIKKLYCYLMYMFNTDSSNAKIISYQQRMDTLYSKLSQADAFFEPELADLDTEYLESLLQDERFKDFDVIIKHIIKMKPHKLDEHTTTLLAKMGSFLGDNSNLHEILTSSELKYEAVKDKNGKLHKLDNANYYKFISSKDRTLRFNSYKSKMNTYKSFNKTFAELYTKDIELDKFYDEIQNYNSVLDRELFNNDVPKKVFENVIKHINLNIPLLQSYIKTRKNDSKLKDFSYIDLFEDSSLKSNYKVEDAKDLIIKALAPLGEEYITHVDKKLNDNSIDYMPNANKYTGGYCSSCYGAKSVILMNFDNSFDSVNTLAHEIGHCINAEYYNKFQPYEKAEITIFAAEIASTVNEILLNLYMQNNSKSDKEKKYFVCEMLENIRKSGFTQTLYSEFELFAHEKIENEEPVNYLDLNKKYLELNKKYYSPACKVPTEIQYAWQGIPHFYNAYYVYSYTTGIITAINIAIKILKEKDFKNKYIDFLKNGIARPAFDVLKEIGIDLSTDFPFISAFDFMKKELAIYKSLCK